MNKYTSLIFTLLIGLSYSQACTGSSYNHSCYNYSTGYGICCSCNYNPFCIAGQSQCCGECGGCLNYETCCIRMQNDTRVGYCLYQKKCCEGGTNGTYFCNSGQDCCGSGMCCSQDVSMTGVIIGSVGGFILIVVIITFCVRKIRGCENCQPICSSICLCCCQLCQICFNSRNGGGSARRADVRPAYTTD